MSDTTESFEQNSYGAYLKWVIPFALLCYIGYFIHEIAKRNRRPKLIDELIAQLEKGGSVVKIDESKAYKLWIPLIFVTFNLCAVQSIHVLFKGQRKFISLPVPAGYMDQLKDVLNENS